MRPLPCGRDPLLHAHTSSHNCLKVFARDSTLNPSLHLQVAAQPPAASTTSSPAPTGATTYSGATTVTPGTSYVTANGASSCATSSSTSWSLPSSSTSYYAYYGLTSATSAVATASKTYSPSTSPSTATGVYTVTFLTNQCPPTAKYNQYSGVLSGYYASPNNYFISLPASSYSVSSLASGAALISPVNGNVGYVLIAVVTSEIHHVYAMVLEHNEATIKKNALLSFCDVSAPYLQFILLNKCLPCNV